MKYPNQMNFKKLHVKTFGCQMNEYDSMKLVHLMRTVLGFSVTDKIADADLIIFNTCSIREKAHAKLFSELGRLRALKKHKPHLIIAVGGCVATQEKENIIKRSPNVDIVFGPQTWQRLPAMYLECINNNQHHFPDKHKTKIVDTDFCADEKFSCLANLANQITPTSQINSPFDTTATTTATTTPLAPTTTTKTNPTAYVTIMEGCNKFCSYCVVPYTRGREISRHFAEIMKEVHSLAAQGVKEICFLGQNVNTYCCPITATDLTSLIHATAQIPIIARIRFMTSHPAHFNDQMIALYASEPKLAAALHLPVQSGSNRILNAMRRNYTHERYRSIVAKVRQMRPNIYISSDFIVGFPGESDEDFAATINLIESVGFDHSFSFIYSPRPRTKAALLEDSVSLSEKKQRLLILQNALNTSASKISEQMLNTTQKVIVIDFSRKSKDENKKTEKNKFKNNITSGNKGEIENRLETTQLFGRTENNRVVNFNGTKELIGEIIEIKIIKILTNSLQGEITNKRR